jgi:hypothetical protein
MRSIETRFHMALKRRRSKPFTNPVEKKLPSEDELPKEGQNIMAKGGSLLLY